MIIWEIITNSENVKKTGGVEEAVLLDRFVLDSVGTEPIKYKFADIQEHLLFSRQKTVSILSKLAAKGFIIVEIRKATFKILEINFKKLV